MTFEFKSEYNDSTAKRKISICKNPLSIAILALRLGVVNDFKLFLLQCYR